MSNVVTLETAVRLWATTVAVALVVFVAALPLLMWRDHPIMHRVFFGAAVYVVVNVAGACAVSAIIATWSVPWP